MRTSAIAVLGFACAAVSSLPARAEAAEPDPLAWHPEWGRFEVPDLVVTGVLAGGLAATLAIKSPPTNFRGGVLFDDPIRDFMRADTEIGRTSAGRVSDVFQAVLIAYPLAIDSVLLTWIARDHPDTALQMFAISTESFLLEQVVTNLTKDVVGRARPYTRSCGNDTCGSTSRNKSFFSGHASSSFTGAGLICAHHEQLALYESSGADTAACAAALVLASATGVLRIVADEHYATDVLAGMVVGLFAGYLFPRLVYYRTAGQFDVGPMVVDGAAGLRISFSR